MTGKIEKHNGKRKDAFDEFSADVLPSPGPADDAGEGMGGSASAEQRVRGDASAAED